MDTGNNDDIAAANNSPLLGNPTCSSLYCSSLPPSLSLSLPIIEVSIPFSLSYFVLCNIFKSAAIASLFSRVVAEGTIARLTDGPSSGADEDAKSFSCCSCSYSKSPLFRFPDTSVARGLGGCVERPESRLAEQTQSGQAESDLACAQQARLEATAAGAASSRAVWVQVAVVRV